MWNIKRDNPAAIQFCWSGSDKQYWVKRRKQYSPSTQVCNNILQVPKFATIFPKYQSLQQYSLKQKLGQLERNPSETLLMFTDSMFSHRIPLNNRVMPKPKMILWTDRVISPLAGASGLWICLRRGRFIRRSQNRFS